MKRGLAAVNSSFAYIVFMSELQNPHDQFVKSVWSKPEVAVSFLQNYLPSQVVDAIDFQSLELSHDSFVDQELRPHHTDLLYKVRLKDRKEEVFIYVLLEHKSYSERFVALQLLRYMLKIWESLLDEKMKSLPVIIPLVLYHGKSRWNVSKQFADVIKVESDALKMYVPAFEYSLCDVSEKSSEEIKGAAMLQIGLHVLQNIFSDKAMEKLLQAYDLFEQMPRQTGLEFMGTVLRYLSAANDRVTIEEIRRTWKEIFSEKEGEDAMATLAEQWMKEGEAKGLQQGRQEGLQEGRQEGEANIVLRQLQKRLGNTDEKIQKQIRELDLNQLERLSEALLDFKTETDLTEWLKLQAN